MMNRETTTKLRMIAAVLNFYDDPMLARYKNFGCNNVFLAHLLFLAFLRTSLSLNIALHKLQMLLLFARHQE